MTLPRSLVGCAMRFKGLYINVSLLMTTLTGVPVETFQAPSTATGRRQLASCVSSSVEVCSQIPFSTHLSIYCCTCDSFVTELVCVHLIIHPARLSVAQCASILTLSLCFWIQSLSVIEIRPSVSKLIKTTDHRELVAAEFAVQESGKKKTTLKTDVGHRR